MATEQALKGINAHMLAVRKSASRQPDYILLRVRGDNTAINNALRTLNAPSKDGDHSQSNFTKSLCRKRR
jgi:hypothetical protein